jgi:hypothetical protein
VPRPVGCCCTLQPGWPDEFVKIRPKRSPTNVSSKLMPLFCREKVAQKWGLLMDFSKNLPRINNCPIGENSPNLVTLFCSRHHNERTFCVELLCKAKRTVQNLQQCGANTIALGYSVSLETPVNYLIF